MQQNSTDTGAARHTKSGVRHRLVSGVGDMTEPWAAAVTAGCNHRAEKYQFNVSFSFVLSLFFFFWRVSLSCQAGPELAILLPQLPKHARPCLARQERFGASGRFLGCHFSRLISATLSNGIAPFYRCVTQPGQRTGL